MCSSYFYFIRLTCTVSVGFLSCLGDDVEETANKFDVNVYFNCFSLLLYPCIILDSQKDSKFYLTTTTQA